MTKAGGWPAALLALAAAPALAQPADKPPSPLAQAQLTWQQCARLTEDGQARLACFDHWARQQSLPAAAVPPAPAVLARTPVPGAQGGSSNAAGPVAGPDAAPVDATVPATRVIQVSTAQGCRDQQYSPLSRFWELENGSDCGTFTFRGYRPLNVSFATMKGAPPVATSPSAGHTGEAVDYQPNEMRIQLSMRTKLAQGLLTQGDPVRKDSLWFAYTANSAWQLFNGEISRPFRNTDHEPELMYVYPADIALPGGWRWRYAGAGLVHQSNGQSLPLSRSWNRVYLMGGMELGDRWSVTARLWKRINESSADDDNPDISKYVGRAELTARWNPNRDHQLGLTVRNNLRSDGRGSVRLEWLYALTDPVRSNLRLHAQLFHGYGDTLLEYNRKRTVFSLGLSLVDF